MSVLFLPAELLREVFSYHGCAVLFRLVNTAWRDAINAPQQLNKLKEEVAEQKKDMAQFGCHPSRSWVYCALRHKSCTTKVHMIPSKQMVSWLSTPSTIEALMPVIFHVLTTLVLSNHCKLSLLADAVAKTWRLCENKCQQLAPTHPWLNAMTPYCIDLQSTSLLNLLLTVSDVFGQRCVLQTLLIPRKPQHSGKANAHTVFRKKIERMPLVEPFLRSALIGPSLLKSIQCAAASVGDIETLELVAIKYKQFDIELVHRYATGQPGEYIVRQWALNHHCKLNQVASVPHKYCSCEHVNSRRCDCDAYEFERPQLKRVKYNPQAEYEMYCISDDDI